MNNPLDAFKSMMIDVEIIRNGISIGKAKGLKNTEKSTNRKYFGFYLDVDIAVGDFIKLCSVGQQYQVIDIDYTTWQGNISSIKAFYSDTSVKSTIQQQTIFNIQNVNNAIIGNQDSANITINNKFSKLIDEYGNEDKEILRELQLSIESILKDEWPIEKGSLSKFKNIIEKHASWIVPVLSDLLIAWFTNR